MVGRRINLLVAALVAACIASAPATAATPVTAAQYRAAATAVCRVASDDIAAAGVSLSTPTQTSPSTAITPLPKLPKKPKSLSQAFASLGSWVQKNQKSLNASLKAMQKEMAPGVVDPKLAPLLQATVQSLGHVITRLEQLEPPPSLAANARAALNDLRHDRGTYALLLQQAQAKKLSFFGLVFSLIGAQQTDGTQETKLWKQLGVPACKMNS